MPGNSRPRHVGFLVGVETLGVGYAAVREEGPDWKDGARAAPIAAFDLVRVDLEDSDDPVDFVDSEPSRR